MLDLSSVVYHNTPSFADWPETAALLEVSWRDRRLTVRHSKSGQWPPVPFETTTQEATLCLFLNYGGKWHAAGAERFRPGQTEKELGSPFDMTGGWLYDANRWGDMANRTLRDGDVVAFCMVSGDMRSQMNPGPRERTNVRLARVSSIGIELLPDTGSSVVTPPVPQQPPPVEVGPAFAELAAQVSALVTVDVGQADEIKALQADVVALALRVETQARDLEAAQARIGILEGRQLQTDTRIATLQAVKIPTYAEVTLFGRTVRVPLR